MEVISASFFFFCLFWSLANCCNLFILEKVTCNHFSSKLRVKADSYSWEAKDVISFSRNDFSHLYYPTVFVTNCASSKIYQSDSVPLKTIN